MGRVTHEQKVLALLSDGQPHSHMEGYRLGVMLHSRVAGLRKKGHIIECDKTGGQYGRVVAEFPAKVRKSAIGPLLATAIRQARIG